MKRWILLFSAVLILFTALFVLYEPEIPASMQITKTATVFDRAMSDGLPYLGVTLDDGTELCLWDLKANRIPDDVKIGDSVTVIYAEQENFDRYILISVEK